MPLPPGIRLICFFETLDRLKPQWLPWIIKNRYIQNLVNILVVDEWLRALD